jgi:predicted adenylyl cyclase CyaB
MSQNFNIEIKTRVSEHENIRQFLIYQNAFFKGVDHQIDTYFPVKKGLLKIREGLIENCIVYYTRIEKKGPKLCEYIIEKFNPDDSVLETMKQILKSALGIQTIIDKKREIYYINNVKFHLDTVMGLGTFIEIEAIGSLEIREDTLRSQCEYYMEQLGITNEQLIQNSYSDMIIEP